jgi:hypothetical protein
MKAYIKQFLTKINLNTDSGAMVSLIAYGVTTQDLSPFTSQLNELNTALDTQLPPSPQRQTHLAINEIVNKFSSVNRPGVPRIAVVFVTDLTDGNYTTLKAAALKATHEHNIHRQTCDTNSNTPLAVGLYWSVEMILFGM